MGNGTFDCAVVDIQTENRRGGSGPRKILTVVATAGDNRLGGANFTDIGQKMISDQLADKVEPQVLEEIRQSNELRTKAEAAKRHLRPQQPYKCTLAKQSVEIVGDKFLVEAKDCFERRRR